MERQTLWLGMAHPFLTLMDMDLLNLETHNWSVLHLFLFGCVLLTCLLLAEQVLRSAAHIQMSWEPISTVHRHLSAERAPLYQLTSSSSATSLSLVRFSLWENLGTPSTALVLIKNMVLIPLIILKNLDSFHWAKCAFIPLKSFFYHMTFHLLITPSRLAKSQISYGPCSRWGLNASLLWGIKYKAKMKG